MPLSPTDNARDKVCDMTSTPGNDHVACRGVCHNVRDGRYPWSSPQLGVVGRPLKRSATHVMLRSPST